MFDRTTHQIDVLRSRFEGLRSVMPKRDTFHRPISTGRIFELGMPSPFQQRKRPLPITVEICTPSLISVLADIIMVTCVAIEQAQSQQTYPSDDQQSPQN